MGRYSKEKIKKTKKTLHISSDDSSALAWAKDKPIETRSIKHVELERLVNSMRSAVEPLKSDHGCTLSFSHIKGVSDKRADYLSRALTAIPEMDPLGDRAPRKKTRQSKVIEHLSAKSQKNRYHYIPLEWYRIPLHYFLCYLYVCVAPGRSHS